MITEKKAVELFSSSFLENNIRSGRYALDIALKSMIHNRWNKYRKHDRFTDLSIGATTEAYVDKFFYQFRLSTIEENKVVYNEFDFNDIETNYTLLCLIANTIEKRFNKEEADNRDDPVVIFVKTNTGFNIDIYNYKHNKGIQIKTVLTDITDSRYIISTLYSVNVQLNAAIGAALVLRMKYIKDKIEEYKRRNKTIPVKYISEIGRLNKVNTEFKIIAVGIIDTLTGANKRLEANENN